MTKKLKKLTEVEPGDKEEFSPSDEYVHPEHEKHLPSPEKLAKAKELEDKINSLQQEIEELQELIYKKRQEQNNASREKDTTSHIDPKLIKIASAIQRDCSGAVKAMQAANVFLYRGIKNYPPEIFVGKPREDRYAKDSDPTIQIKFDNLLKETGFTALRSNSIFCSSSRPTAAGYGNIYMIFPKNGFGITWSRIYSDLYSDLLSDLRSKGFDSIFHSRDYEIAKNSLISNIESIRTIVYDARYQVQRSSSLTDSEQFIEQFGVPSNIKGSAIKIFNNKDLVKNVLEKAKQLCTDVVYAIRGGDNEYSTSGAVTENFEPKLTQLLQILRRLDGINIIEVFKNSSLRNYLSNAQTKLIEPHVLSSIKEFNNARQLPLSSAEEVIKDKFEFENNNLEGALNSANEVCISGEYYAIASTYFDQFSEMFGISN